MLSFGPKFTSIPRKQSLGSDLPKASNEFQSSPSYVYDSVGDRCLQTCVDMVLRSNGIVLNSEAINRITSYVPGKNSQFSIATLALAERLPFAHLYTKLDMELYALKGEKYLAKVFSRDWLEHQRENSSPNFRKERAAALKVFNRGRCFTVPSIFETVDATSKFLKELLSKNRMIITSLDTGILYGGETSAHAVLAYRDLRDSKSSIICYHDPDAGDISGKGIRIPIKLFAGAVRTHLLAVSCPPSIKLS